MKFNSIEEFLDYLEEANSPPTEDTTDKASTVSNFDNNTLALNVLFRNAMNSKAFSIAYDIIVYANSQQITLTKGH